MQAKLQAMTNVKDGGEEYRKFGSRPVGVCHGLIRKHDTIVTAFRAFSSYHALGVLGLEMTSDALGRCARQMLTLAAASRNLDMAKMFSNHGAGRCRSTDLDPLCAYLLSANHTRLPALVKRC